MEKIKHLLNPGKDVDDEIMYGSGTSPDPVHSGNTGTLTGEGSHLASARNVPKDGSGTANDSGTTAGPHSSDFANKADPRVDSDLDGSRNAPVGTGAAATTGHNIMPGGFPSTSASPYSHKELDPRLDGGNTTAAGATTATDATGSTAPSSGYNTTGSTGVIGQDPEGRTDHHLGRDAAAVGTAGAVGEGIHHHKENERENLSASGYGPTTGGSNISGSGPNMSANITTATGTTAPITAGPHSSDLMNKADPRVDSDNSKSTGNTGAAHNYGRDAAAVGAVGAVTEGVHHHRQNEKEAFGNSGYGTTTGGSNITGPGPNTSANTATTTTTTGPHNSSLMNKMDPRVDSDKSKAIDGSGTDHQYGRDAAAVGGAAAIAEGIHHHRENERGNVEPADYPGTTPSGVGSSYYGGPSGTAVSDVSGPHSTSTANRLDPRINKNAQPIDNAGEHDPLTGGGGASADTAHGLDQHHLGRDAAIGTGAAGLAKHEHSKHENERATDVRSTADPLAGTGVAPEGTVGPHGSRLANAVDPRVDSDLDGSRQVGGATAGVSSTTGPASAIADTEHGNTVTSTAATGNPSHHYGRDAAIGAGGVGLAEHERRKHEQESDLGRDSNLASTSTTGTGPAPNTSGPHKKDWMNKLDPRVNSSPTSFPTGPTGSHATTDTAAETTGMRNRNAYIDPAARDSPGFVSSAAQPGHPTHGERDAVAGAGLTGAAGYQAEKHHAAGNQHGVSEGYDEKDLSKSHHYGKDAAAVGAAGVGAHEISKHHNERNRTNEPGYTPTTGTTTGTTAGTTTGLATCPTTGHATGATGATTDLTTGQYGAQAVGVGGATGLNEHEQLKREAASNQPGNHYGQNNFGDSAPAREEKGHHLGRDATGAGVVGAGAYEAEKHHKHDKDLTAAEKEEKREIKREEKEAKRERKEEKKHSGGLLGFLHRDKNKKYTKDEEDEFDRQEREYNDHPGRDAAIGGAVVGGTAYEAEKHHNHHGAAEAEPDTMKPLPTAPGNHGIGTGEGTQNALVMDRKRGEGYDTTSTTDPSHHYGRDATAVGGAAALAEHEHNKNQHGHPHVPGTEDYKPPGATLGDKLHGVDRNRGTTATDVSGVPAGEYAPGTTTTGTSHLGRDAAVGAGGVGLAEHEHRKHGLEHGSEIGQTAPTTATTAAGSGIGHTTPAGNTATSSSSGIGYGATDPVTSLLGANTQPERVAGYRAPTAPKHNVLHKDPPPGHPASGMTGTGTDYSQDPQRTAGGPGAVNPR